MSLTSINVNNTLVARVDSEPTVGSDNLVKSGGVYNIVQPLKDEVDGVPAGTQDYGCTEAATYGDLSGLDYWGSYSPCEKKGIIKQITGYFGASGTMKVAICYIENGLAVVGDEYDVVVPGNGNQIIDVEALKIGINAGGILVAKLSASRCHPCYGINQSVTPFGISIRVDGSYSIRSYDGVYCSLSWTVKYGSAGLIKEVDNINKDINGAPTSVVTYGCLESAAYSDLSGIIYWGSNVRCEDAGIIENIIGTFGAAGTMVVTTGFIDQNNRIIIGKEYNVNVPSARTNVVIDVSSLNISIKSEEFLLAKANLSTHCHPCYQQSATVEPTGIGVTSDYAPFYYTDVYASFAWTVKTEKKGINNEINELNVRVTTLEESNINKNLYVTDSVTGVRYKIISTNGVLGLQEMSYQKVLVLGNSITIHGYAEVWGANNRGMAATKKEYDFCGILETQMDAEVKRKNMASWEVDFTVDLSTLIGNDLTNDTDLVIIRLGENVTNISGFETALGNLVTYIQTNAPAAKIVITGLFWTNQTKENAIINVCEDFELDYIQINQYDSPSYKEKIGHYSYNTDYTAIFEITNSGVALHPSNIGMCAIANAILSDLSYDLSENTYSLRSVTVGGVTGMMYVKN